MKKALVALAGIVFAIVFAVLLYRSYCSGSLEALSGVNLLAPFLLTVLGGVGLFGESVPVKYRRYAFIGIVAVGVVATLFQRKSTIVTGEKAHDLEKKRIAAEGERSRAEAARDESLKGLAASVGEVKRLQGENSRLQDRLLRQNDLIAQLARRSINNVTGADSFAYLDLVPRTANDMQLVVVHQGHYPLYNLSVRIFDFDSPFPNTPEGFARQVVKVGDLAVGKASVLLNYWLRLTGRQKVRLNVFFDARNGSWVQLIKLVWRNDHFARATAIKRDDAPGVLIWKRVDKDFPASELPTDMGGTAP